MTCPKCGKEMELRKADVSSDNRINKEYDRTIYACDTDDVYVTVEIPK